MFPPLLSAGELKRRARFRGCVADTAVTKRKAPGGRGMCGHRGRTTTHTPADQNETCRLISQAGEQVRVFSGRRIEAAFLCTGRHFPFEAARGRNEPCQDRPQRKRGKRGLIPRHQSHISGFYATIRPLGEERAGRNVRSERIKTPYVGLVLSERLWRLLRHPTS